MCVNFHPAKADDTVIYTNACIVDVGAIPTGICLNVAGIDFLGISKVWLLQEANALKQIEETVGIQLKKTPREAMLVGV